ncbi:MAG: apolipoprotein N-acyltransferase [Lentimicrobiaceae bacterium]|jgi:apolipoprotein N-acyltransferase|nr:apolipoprotein N-acyltransferase [Lentimicrobiaceae bacterium]
MKRIYPIGLAVLSGLLLSASWPVNGFTPLIFVAFVPLLFLQDAVGEMQKQHKYSNIFLLSFLSFFIWNALTTWWIWNSTSIGSIAAFMLNALLMATVFWLFHFTKTHLQNNNNGNLILVFFLMSFEYLHLHWDLNWPWLNLGNVFAAHHTWIQWYEYTGVAGGTLWILVVNLLVFSTIKSALNWRKDKKKISVLIAILLAAIFIPIVYSKQLYKDVKDEGKDVEIVVVQPNFDPFNEQFQLPSNVIIDRNLELAESLVTTKTRFVIGPESAIQEAIWIPDAAYFPSIRAIKKFIEHHPQVAYVIGASTFGPVPNGSENDFEVRKMNDNEYYYAYNTAFMVDSVEIKHYNKKRFTPGVEMMPSWFFVRPLQSLAIDLGGTVGSLKGDGTTDPFVFGAYRPAPLICYESVFGEFVTEFVRNGANIIFIITNDGWWGNTPGYRQHHAYAKLRAIETRRNIARSANTGTSSFINLRGDVLQQTNYWEPAALRQTIRTNETITFYVRYGDYLYRIAVFLMTMLFLVAFVNKLLKRKSIRLR